MSDNSTIWPSGFGPFRRPRPLLFMNACLSFLVGSTIAFGFYGNTCVNLRALPDGLGESAWLWLRRLAMVRHASPCSGRKLSPHLTAPNDFADIAGSRISASVGGNMKFRGFSMLLLVLILPLLAPSAYADATILQTAAPFAVLAGSAVTNTGSSVITAGDVGVSPGAAISGFPPGIVTAPGTIHNSDAVALHAQTD